MTSRWGQYDLELEHKETLALRHAMADYEWCGALDGFRQYGILQSCLALVLMGLVRTACIIFWENMFATILAAAAFSFALLRYGQFGPLVVAYLIFCGVFFLLPVFCFIVLNLRLEIRAALGMGDEEYKAMFIKTAETMNDVLKPFQFLSPIILFFIPMGWIFLIR